MFAGTCGFRAAADSCVARRVESVHAAGEAAAAAALYLCGEDMRAMAAAYDRRVARGILDTELPFDAHRRCTGRLAVSLVHVGAWPTVHEVDVFATRADLVDVLVAAAHVPVYTDGRAWAHARLRRYCAYPFTPRARAPQARTSRARSPRP